MTGVQTCALPILNVYWFCYEAIRLWGVDIGVVDRILMNFNRTAGLFHSILYTKLFAVLLLALSCLGTKGVKGEKITWGRIWTALAAGFVLFFLNWWILALPLPVEAVTGLYALTVGTGYVCLLDRKSTRLNSSHLKLSRMPSSA